MDLDNDTIIRGNVQRKRAIVLGNEVIKLLDNRTILTKPQLLKLMDRSEKLKSAKLVFPALNRIDQDILKLIQIATKVRKRKKALKTFKQKGSTTIISAPESKTVTQRRKKIRKAKQSISSRRSRTKADITKRKMSKRGKKLTKIEKGLQFQETTGGAARLQRKRQTRASTRVGFTSPAGRPDVIIQQSSTIRRPPSVLNRPFVVPSIAPPPAPKPFIRAAPPRPSLLRSPIRELKSAPRKKKFKKGKEKVKVGGPRGRPRGKLSAKELVSFRRRRTRDLNQMRKNANRIVLPKKKGGKLPRSGGLDVGRIGQSNGKFREVYEKTDGSHGWRSISGNKSLMALLRMSSVEHGNKTLAGMSFGNTGLGIRRDRKRSNKRRINVIRPIGGQTRVIHRATQQIPGKKFNLGGQDFIGVDTKGS